MSGRFMDKEQLREQILQRVRTPEIPSENVSLLEFGAVPDSEQLQTHIIQRAIDEVSSRGGGRLVVPKGRYKTGAIRLKSKVELHLEDAGSVLSFVGEEPEKNYPLVFSHWEATPCLNYSALIYACDSHDIAVTGPGLLDGGADWQHWWCWHHQVENAWSENRPDLQLEDRKQLRAMNMDGTPIQERKFGPGHYLRPNFIQVLRCERVLLSGFTIQNSPMWQLNPVMCKSVVMEGLTLSSHGPNNDGCDPESCSGVIIRRCRFDTGDDCISLKSGRDRDGREANTPCEWVLIEENEFADGHGGIALGSEMSGGIRNVMAVKNQFTSPSLTYPLRLKTNARRGGCVENIILADSRMDQVGGAAVHGTMMYEDGPMGEYLPAFRNILIENVRAHGGEYGIFLEAFSNTPISGLVLRNIQIDGVRNPMHSMNWQDPVIENVTINGRRFPCPGRVRIDGIPVGGETVSASAEYLGGRGPLQFHWQMTERGAEDGDWKEFSVGNRADIPKTAAFLRILATDEAGEAEMSRSYRVLLSEERYKRDSWDRLLSKGSLDRSRTYSPEQPITYEMLARMLVPFAGESGFRERGTEECIAIAVEKKLLSMEEDCRGEISRQKMATVAMQSCGIDYKNASSTMPVCKDADRVGTHYGTNVMRALYFGFMELDEEGYFHPETPVTVGEAVEILNRTALFAGF